MLAERLTRPLGAVARAWALLRDPVTAEKRRLLAQRWAELPAALRLPGQGLGRQATGCGATLGVEPRCDFACTGCYLGGEANTVPPLPLAAVLAQLDRLRLHLGPKANVQITDGEVTLRPLPELLEILRYARHIGVVPMLMTHGDGFRRQPGLLERLLVDGGLTEVAIHVDSTQRGRDGYRQARSELELMPLREELAALVRRARRRTGRRLRAAMTMTVTTESLPQVGDVVRWCLRNRDAFGLLSLQPLARVGRTRRGLAGVAPTDLWAEIGRAVRSLGADLRGDGPLHFGHPGCTRVVPLLVLQRRREESPRLLPLVRDDPADRALLADYLARGLAGATFRDDPPLARLARGAGMLRRQPRWLLGEVRRWADRRLRAEAGLGFGAALLGAVTGRLRIDAFTLTSHHFMDAGELATEAGRERLAACVFRVPLGDGLAPMCEVNAGGLRELAYAEQRAALAADWRSRRQQQPPPS